MLEALHQGVSICEVKGVLNLYKSVSIFDKQVVLVALYQKLLQINFETGIIIGYNPFTWNVLFNRVMISSPLHQAVQHNNLTELCPLW